MGNRDIDNGESDHFAPPSPPSETDYRHARWPRFGESPGHSDLARLDGRERPSRNSPDLLVVGVCSSGKSTLVRKLRQVGYDVRACAQEHSFVPNLWQLSQPRALVYLDADLNTIRRRRRANWSQPVLDEQHRRLSHAREHCDIYVSTDSLSPDEVATRVIDFLSAQSPVIQGQ